MSEETKKTEKVPEVGDEEKLEGGERLERLIKRKFPDFSMSECCIEHESDGMEGVLRYLVEDVCSTPPVAFPHSVTIGGNVYSSCKVPTGSLAAGKGDRIATFLKMLGEIFGEEVSESSSKIYMSEGCVRIGVAVKSKTRDDSDASSDPVSVEGAAPDGFKVPNAADEGKDTEAKGGRKDARDGEEVKIRRVNAGGKKRDRLERIIREFFDGDADGGDEDEDERFSVIELTGEDAERVIRRMRPMMPRIDDMFSWF